MGAVVGSSIIIDELGRIAICIGDFSKLEAKKFVEEGPQAARKVAAMA